MIFVFLFIALFFGFALMFVKYHKEKEQNEILKKQIEKKDKELFDLKNQLENQKK